MAIEPEKDTYEPAKRKPRTRTSTSNFGVHGREGHDSSPFYARFTPPEISKDETIPPPWNPPDPFICGDSSQMDEIPDNSVALVVTSPPYFVGKEYEEALGEGHIPATYFDYLEMLSRVFEQCKRHDASLVKSKGQPTRVVRADLTPFAVGKGFGHTAAA